MSLITSKGSRCFPYLQQYTLITLVAWYWLVLRDRLECDLHTVSKSACFKIRLSKLA